MQCILAVQISTLDMRDSSASHNDGREGQQLSSCCFLKRLAANRSVSAGSAGIKRSSYDMVYARGAPRCVQTGCQFLSAIDHR